MADTSPGNKVQVLRAMFAQKNEPVMGVMKPGVKSNRPWNRTSGSLSEDSVSEEKQRIAPVSITATQAMLRAIQTNNSKNPNGNSCDNTRKMCLKPSIGPKPSSFSQGRTFSSTTFNASNNSSLIHNTHKNKTMFQRSYSNETSSNIINKTDTVASFMFGSSDKNHSEENRYTDEPRCRPLPISKPSANLTNKAYIKDLSNSGDNMKPKNSANVTDIKSHLNLINSDNYICKSRSNIRKKDLPPKDKLGPPPLKPVKPPDMKLPEPFFNRINNLNFDASAKQSIQEIKPNLPPKKGENNFFLPQKPPYPCPPRPSTSPPVPPLQKSSALVLSSCSISQSSEQNALFQEVAQLYEDALSEDSNTRIPEYTEEEELGLDELYDDALVENYRPNKNNSPYFKKPNYPHSSSHQSHYLAPTIIDEVYYQDTADQSLDEDGEVYEVMPADDLLEEHYTNNSKEMEKIQQEEQKRLKKENKEKQKKEKEIEKLRKKFGLTGDEVIIDYGLVKTDSKGGRFDLYVKKGEVVDILRIEGNPVGKWLVKNKKDKCGYVELTNIEVMTIKRSSVISASEELYNEAYSEQEGIYEVTY